MDRSPRITRRRFVRLTGAAMGLTGASACASNTRSNDTGATNSAGTWTSSVRATTARTYTPDRFDPRVEAIGGVGAGGCGAD